MIAAADPEFSMIVIEHLCEELTDMLLYLETDMRPSVRLTDNGMITRGDARPGNCCVLRQRLHCDCRGECAIIILRLVINILILPSASAAGLLLVS